MGATGPPLQQYHLHRLREIVESVQVQYPDALQTMLTDLRSIRNWAGYLQKTEIKFDMLSAVDELAKQVKSASACCKTRHIKIWSWPSLTASPLLARPVGDIVNC